jgi:hypothetical protein
LADFIWNSSHLENEQVAFFLVSLIWKLFGLNSAQDSKPAKAEIKNISHAFSNFGLESKRGAFNGTKTRLSHN